MTRQSKVTDGDSSVFTKISYAKLHNSHVIKGRQTLLRYSSCLYFDERFSLVLNMGFASLDYYHGWFTIYVTNRPVPAFGLIIIIIITLLTLPFRAFQG